MPGKTSSSALGSSTAVEDYLERILGLINSKGYARVVDIAAALKISQASVTNMVQRLDGEGLLKYEKYRGLILTGAGKKLARKIAHRHKLLTDFLSLLGLDERVIYHDVEGMEHHISPPCALNWKPCWFDLAPMRSCRKMRRLQNVARRKIDNRPRPTTNQQRDWATTDGAVLDQCLFWLQCIDLDPENFAAMRTGNCCICN
jgi:Mn-dependent DtxR family transcriptional regulator